MDDHIFREIQWRLAIFILPSEGGNTEDPVTGGNGLCKRVGVRDIHVVWCVQPVPALVDKPGRWSMRLREDDFWYFILPIPMSKEELGRRAILETSLDVDVVLDEHVASARHSNMLQKMKVCDFLHSRAAWL